MSMTNLNIGSPHEHAGMHVAGSVDVLGEPLCSFKFDGKK